MKLAILAFLYCGESVKNPSVFSQNVNRIVVQWWFAFESHEMKEVTILYDECYLEIPIDRHILSNISL